MARSWAWHSAWSDEAEHVSLPPGPDVQAPYDAPMRRPLVHHPTWRGRCGCGRFRGPHARRQPGSAPGVGLPHPALRPGRGPVGELGAAGTAAATRRGIYPTSTPSAASRSGGWSEPWTSPGSRDRVDAAVILHGDPPAPGRGPGRPDEPGCGSQPRPDPARPPWTGDGPPAPWTGSRRRPRPRVHRPGWTAPPRVGDPGAGLAGADRTRAGRPAGPSSADGHHRHAAHLQLRLGTRGRDRGRSRDAGRPGRQPAPSGPIHRVLGHTTLEALAAAGASSGQTCATATRTGGGPRRRHAGRDRRRPVGAFHLPHRTGWAVRGPPRARVVPVLRRAPARLPPHGRRHLAGHRQASGPPS